jgi:hypothetical protein
MTLSITTFNLYAKCGYAECRYAECHGAEWANKNFHQISLTFVFLVEEQFWFCFCQKFSSSKQSFFIQIESKNETELQNSSTAVT